MVLAITVNTVLAMAVTATLFNARAKFDTFPKTDAAGRAADKVRAVVERALEDGAPWTLGHSDTQTASIFVVVGTRRGASTEVAEIIGNHPCGYSFNEMLKHGHFPTGYEKYRHRATDLASYLNPQIFRDAHWLDDARRARAEFCAGRPRVVRETCGGVCVVALKMHVKAYLNHNNAASWKRLLSASDVASFIVTRNTLQNHCSLGWATTNKCWGHNPNQKGEGNCTPALRPPCVASNKSRTFGRKVMARMNVTRATLASAGRGWLELPFETYIADPVDGARRVLAAAGLAVPALAWSTTCAVAWCTDEAKSWPACGDNLATCLAIE